MKKMYFALVLAILTFTFNANAQVVTKITAKDGYDIASQKAEESLTNPELLLIGIGNANSEQFPVNPDFDFDTGKSMLWIYIFQESGESKFKAYIAYNVPIIGIQATEIPFDQLLPMLPIQPEGSIDNNDWIDSDEMITEFKTEDKIKDYLDNNPNPGMYFIGLFNIAENPMIPNNKTYWSLIFYDEDLPLTCVMDAYTKEIWCGIQFNDFEGFTAKAAFDEVKLQAIDDGIENPETLMVMTMKTGIEGLPFQNKYDFENGTSGFWAYLFRDKNNNENMKAYAAWKMPPSGYKIQEIGVDLVLDLLPVSTIAPLENDDWPDSDYTMDVFNQHSYFNDFITEHPDPWTYEIGIFVNEDNPQIDPFQGYWGIAIVDDETTRDSLACVMNIDNEQIKCGTLFSDVEDYIKESFSIYPNPADEYLMISIPEIVSSSASIVVYDVIGNPVIVKKSLDEIIKTIDVGHLSSGVYMMKIINNTKILTKKFIIDR